MKTIEIEDLVFASLERRVLRFGDTPNDVIKRLLEDLPAATEAGAPTSDSVVPQTKHPLVKLIESSDYLVKNGKKKYFDVIRTLYQLSPSIFEKFDGFSRGSRVNIAKDIKFIERSGSSTMPEKLSGTPYFVLTNLDNKSKREILNEIMTVLGISPNIITAVVQTIADSGITRSKTRRSRNNGETNLSDF